MSRIVRKQLFEILNTLQSANDMLEGLFADASNSAMIDLLADCQNCAITMGNKIEAVYGEGTASVKALENYCESIYLVSQNLEQPDVCQEHYANSKEHLKAVAACMEQEIPDKMEIVFMPYKASMWDSLESVYLATREDETCEAYVVSIPYYDRKPDKSLGEMHCDCGEYPKNIPITDWEQYNFEERCPDVIYIHNAYDDMNLVTCVHPRFFSSNLKKYTGELIYIPYFVLEEIEPDDQAKIDNMKHFCVLPGIIHANKVILQSEKMSQIYINEYAKAFEAAGAVVDREQLKQKFLGLGSPKFDKVVNTKKEDVEVPVEWLNIIQKPDGTWKKIVFYNTTVTALLNHDEKMLIKMKNVFEIFKERQDEVALLWRPHPLIRTTIEAMRPQLWADYAKLVEQYKAEGWGIYDDTADMDRAIALSDAYYGDQSSIVQLCQKAGMPVMVQDVDNLVKQENEDVFTNAYLFSLGAEIDRDNGVLWAVTCLTDSLLKIDLETGKLLESYNIPVSRIKEYDFITVKKVGGCLYIGEYNADTSYCFFIEEKRFEKILFPFTEGENEKGRKIKRIFLINDAIYFVGVNVKAIIKLDLKTREVNRIEGFAKNSNIFAHDGIVVNELLYIPLAEENVILELNTVDDSWRERIVDGSSDVGFRTITTNKDGFILTDEVGKQILYDMKRSKVTRFDLNDVPLENAMYDAVLEHEDEKYYFLTYYSDIIVRNGETVKENIQYDYLHNPAFGTMTYSKFGFIKNEVDYIYFQMRTSGDICRINKKTKEIAPISIIIEGGYKEIQIMKVLKNYINESIRENEVFKIDAFLLTMGKGYCV